MTRGFVLIWGTVLALVVGVRVASVLHWSEFRFPDESWYTEIAQNLIDGNGYVMEADGHNRFAVCKAPALPFVLAAFGWLIELTPVAVKLVNQLMNLGGILFLAGTLGLMMRSVAASSLFILICGFFPPLIYTGATNYPQNGQLLMLGALFFSMAWKKYKRPAAFLSKRWMVLDGILVAAGGLFVPTHIYILPGLFLFWWHHARKAEGFRFIPSTAQYAVLGLVGVLIALGPWISRNAVAEHAFIPFTATAGQQFYTGNNPRATMNSGTSVGFNPGMKEKLDQTRTAKEFEQVHWDEAWEWVRHNRSHAFKLTVQKTLNYFRWDNGGLNMKDAEVGSGLMWVQRISSLFAAGMLLVSIFLKGEARLWGITVAVMLLFTAVGHGIFISRYRYRIPFEPLMIMMGMAAVLHGIANLIRQRMVNDFKQR